MLLDHNEMLLDKRNLNLKVTFSQINTTLILMVNRVLNATGAIQSKNLITLS